ncbi:unnamed protein product [Mytilus coruscus]|uniref:Uncharacterized protein n=1 Tax=Mytilus coruscus TaxID=42192 RepID=A0A6J8CHP4_MYTCO|nr:unnamed protein product [Mytilus coruscus]
MSRTIDENDTATYLKPGHTKPITDQDKCTDCERSSEHNTLVPNSIQLSKESQRVLMSCDEVVPSGKNPKPFTNTSAHNNPTSSESHRIVDTSENASVIQPEKRILIDNSEKETDKKVQSSMKHKISKQFKKMSPYVLPLVIIGLVCYFICNRNGASRVSKRESMFVNLIVNFDLYRVETTYGKIPWRPIDSNVVVLEGNGTTICVLQPGSYYIDVTLNLDNRRNKDPVTVSVCILNSRDRNGNRCIPEVLPAHMQRSVTVSVNLNLQKGDTIWVNVKGLNLVYQRPDVNNMSIIKYDT